MINKNEKTFPSLTKLSLTPFSRSYMQTKYFFIKLFPSTNKHTKTCDIYIYFLMNRHNADKLHMCNSNYMTEFSYCSKF